MKSGITAYQSSWAQRSLRSLCALAGLAICLLLGFIIVASPDADSFWRLPIHSPAILLMCVGAFVLGSPHKDGLLVEASNEDNALGKTGLLASLRVAADTLRDGIVIVDGSFKIIYINAKASKLLSLRDSHANLGNSQAGIKLRSILEQVIRDKSELRGEIAVAKGVTEAASSNPTVFVRAFGIDCDSCDLTAVATLEDRSIEGVARQQSRDSAADAAHDLRAPLTAVMGCAEVLQDGKNFKEEREARHLEMILHECSKMSVLISDILDVSLLDADRVIIDFYEVDLRCVFDSVVEVVAKAVSDYRMKVSTSVDEECRMVKGDCLRIQQCLTNLMVNAITYSPPGSSIHIDAKRDGDFVKISVADEGIGISEEHISHVWERFFRSKRRKTATEGTGLGLAIVKKITELHGGVVGVQSQLGNGAEFWFTVPANK